MNNFFICLKKLTEKKKICPGPLAYGHFFPLWYQMEKKTSFGGGTKRGLKKESFYFHWSPKGFFFHLMAQRKSFSFWYPKGKKILIGWWTWQFFLFFFWQFFQTWEQVFNFWNFEKMKVAKSKVNHLGWNWNLNYFDRAI